MSGDLYPRLLSISKENHRHTQIRCIYVSSLCLVVAITCTVFEAFAASTFIFCHQLDIVFLYWSFWTLLQVGSTIAIFGIGLARLWSYMGRESLPVNQSELNAEAENQACASSVPTAELLGFTLDSRPIIAFPRLSGAPHPMARYLSTTDDGRSIYIYGAIPTDTIDVDINSNSVRRSLYMAAGKMEQSGRISRTVTFDCEPEASSASVSSTTSRTSLLGSIRGERSTSRSPISVGGSRLGPTNVCEDDVQEE
ncbi:hypothetical protein BHYA_0004g00640 [Botrytis hyacinthi]|uniref:Uncharacterized protein n=1 Tax=Botrytis hyacinthi TaxID=278943 RepID=A0A4Z1H245_9HELO|nr:hypothetical protein BHYA_0004g00640 [Botrytis hyacinthi]